MRDSDGFVSFQSTLQAAAFERYTIKIEGEQDRLVELPTKSAYQNIKTEYIYDVKNPSIQTPPTKAIVRVEDEKVIVDIADVVQELKVDDTKAWADMYIAMPEVAVNPFSDSPKPIDVGLDVAVDPTTGTISVTPTDIKPINPKEEPIEPGIEIK